MSFCDQEECFELNSSLFFSFFLTYRQDESGLEQEPETEGQVLRFKGFKGCYRKRKRQTGSAGKLKRAFFGFVQKEWVNAFTALVAYLDDLHGLFKSIDNLMYSVYACWCSGSISPLKLINPEYFSQREIFVKHNMERFGGEAPLDI